MGYQRIGIVLPLLAKLLRGQASDATLRAVPTISVHLSVNIAKATLIHYVNRAPVGPTWNAGGA